MRKKEVSEWILKEEEWIWDVCEEGMGREGDEEEEGEEE